MSDTKKDKKAIRTSLALANRVLERGMGGTFPYVRTVRRRTTRSDRQRARRNLNEMLKSGSFDRDVDPRFDRDSYFPVFKANGSISRSSRLLEMLESA